MAHYYKPSDNI